MDRRLFLASSLLLAASPLVAAERRPQALLLRRLPGLSKTLSRVALTEGPSPITEARGLGDVLGLSRLYIKRDDLACATYAGSKVRKLELFAPLGIFRLRGLGRGHAPGRYAMVAAALAALLVVWVIVPTTMAAPASGLLTLTTVATAGVGYRWFHPSDARAA